MGLVECPDCGKEISDSSVFCVGCGRPIEKAAEVQKIAPVEPKSRPPRRMQESSIGVVASSGIFLVMLGVIAFLFYLASRSGFVDMGIPSQRIEIVGGSSYALIMAGALIALSGIAAGDSLKGNAVPIQTEPPKFFGRSTWIICPNVHCGYRGQAKQRSTGSILILLILLCFFVIPGIIYAIAWSGYALYCPKCGIKVRDR